MSFFSEVVSVDGLFRIFQFIAYAAGALAVLALIGKDVTNSILSERKTKEMLVLQKAVDDASAARAQAETKLLELQRFVKEPRRINTSRAFEAFRKAPKASAVVRYVENNEDAMDFAFILSFILKETGWEVEHPDGGTSRPPSSGITLEYRYERGTMPTFTETDLSASGKVLFEVLQEADGVGKIKLQPRDDLSAETYFVIVGPKL